MKKIFSILAAAVIAFSFSSCENGNSATGGNKDIKIAVTGISAKSAFVAVTPTDNEVAFWYSYVSTNDLKSYSDSMTIEEYAADDMSYYPSEGYSFEELANYGLLLDTLSLIPETEYYVYAYTFNEKFEITSDIVVVKFTTPAQAVAGKENLAITGEFYDGTASSGYFQATGYNADETKYLGLLVFADSLNTSFTVDDLYTGMSYLVDLSGEEIEFFDITKANLTSAFNEANATLAITGTFVASNDIQYTLNLTATETAPDAPKAAAKKNIRGTKDLRLRK